MEFTEITISGLLPEVADLRTRICAMWAAEETETDENPFLQDAIADADARAAAMEDMILATEPASVDEALVLACAAVSRADEEETEAGRARIAETALRRIARCLLAECRARGSEALPHLTRIAATMPPVFQAPAAGTGRTDGETAAAA